MKTVSPRRRVRHAPIVAATLVALVVASAHAADLSLDLAGDPTVVFDPGSDGCTPDDIPDVNARAFRDGSGRTVVFALHDANRALVGPDLAHLRIDCHSALPSPEKSDPARYEDRNFVAATWTEDGLTVGALVHHEYHADSFGRCSATGDMACWYNTVLAYRSRDAGRDFARLPRPVVASAPFRQEVEQGRHRGFFNPSNIFADGTKASPWRYALISTTGWTGQPYGNCLFRTADPAGGDWRAWDGHAFAIRYDDPYRSGFAPPRPCRTIPPFTFPVGTVVWHAGSKRFVAIMQAKAGGAFPLSGFYASTSRDLTSWSPPQLVLAASTLYDDLCTVGGSVAAYPSILDPGSTSRNYDTVGDAPDLFFTRIAVDKCGTGRRLLLRQRLNIRLRAPS